MESNDHPAALPGVECESDHPQEAQASPQGQGSQADGYQAEAMNGSPSSSGALSSRLDHTDDHEQAKNAYYNYASEKLLSHTESKLFFHRHQLENAQQDGGPQNPLARSRTLSSKDDVARNKERTWTTEMDERTGQVRQTAPDSDIAPKGQQSQQYAETLRTVASKDKAARLRESDQYPFDHIDSQDTKAFDTHQGSDISPELTGIARSIRKILKLRKRYIDISLQGPNDNPRDDPKHWKIYPPPPNPTWSVSNQPVDHDLSHDESHSIETFQPQQLPRTPTSKPRKPGLNIGEDFSMEDCEPLPIEDTTTTFNLDPCSIYQIYQDSSASGSSLEMRHAIVNVPTLNDFYRDMDEVQNVSSDGPIKSFAYRQLDILEGKFHLYNLVNAYQEMADCKKVPHRDFYNVRKVDTHVHHSACMNQKHLLRFIKSKMRKSPNDLVLFRDGQHLTLEGVFDSINLTAYDLSIDTLDMHAHTDSFHRFDKFNLKYNPIGESRLREIFLKTDNYIKGRYLAEITKEVISDLESSKYQFVEWRVSIYGRSLDEWDKLAAWVIDNKLVSHNVRWLVQVPRLYSIYKASGQMETFEEVIVNLFQPLYEVTRNPASHAKLHVFLQRVVGFDSVDDESKIETRLYRKFPRAKEWNTKQNPPYTYWIYHLFANMTSLNRWRKARGFNTFVLRPHCGEAGDIDHIAAAVLCCHSISHGLLLRKVPLLQYIFYLDQIGIAMSPLSNNALFIAYDRNPFLKYFKRGLNVSLSTDDPLQFAFTKEPLIEEYSVAAQIYRLSAVDMCELAHHSVIQSGFEHELKQRWLGPDYHRPGIEGNSVAKSNVPNIRERFRFETLRQEHEMLERYAQLPPELPSITPTPQSSQTLPARPKNIATTKMPPKASVTGSSNQSGPPPNAHEKTSQAPQSPSLSASPSMSRSSYWADGAYQPRMFPGIVHQRTRKSSMRQGSGSEKGLDAAAAAAAGAGLGGLTNVVQQPTSFDELPAASMHEDESD